MKPDGYCSYESNDDENNKKQSISCFPDLFPRVLPFVQFLLFLYTIGNQLQRAFCAKVFNPFNFNLLRLFFFWQRRWTYEHRVAGFLSISTPEHKLGKLYQRSRWFALGEMAPQHNNRPHQAEPDKKYGRHVIHAEYGHIIWSDRQGVSQN